MLWFLKEEWFLILFIVSKVSQTSTGTRTGQLLVWYVVNQAVHPITPVQQTRFGLRERWGGEGMNQVIHTGSTLKSELPCLEWFMAFSENTSWTMSVPRWFGSVRGDLDGLVRFGRPGLYLIKPHMPTWTVLVLAFSLDLDHPRCGSFNYQFFNDF